MRLNILIAGKAGQGLNILAELVGKSLADAGLYVFNYRDYQSLIAGGHNFNILCVSDKPVYSFDLNYDIALLLDDKSFDKHKGIKKNAVILTNTGRKYNSKTIFLETANYKKVENIYFAGCLFKILGLDKKFLKEEIEKVFAGKGLLNLDLEIMNKAYDSKYKFNLGIQGSSKNNKFITPRKSSQIQISGAIKNHITSWFLTGAEAVGIGAIEAGLDIYYGYPMTPATTLLTYLAQHQEKYNFFVFEPENEIAIANMALGSSFSGARVMIGSSGGGFDLMTEALSMQGMTELPLVVYLASRPGPSSGTPTFSSQQDLNLALNCGHGEFPRIVACPGDIEECYKTSKELFYLAEKYKCLGILLVDKHVAESGYTQKIGSYNLAINKTGKYPGKDLVKVNSYSHDEKGNFSENPENIVKLLDKFNKKRELLRKEVEKFETFKVYGNKNSKKVIVGFGSTKGAIIDSLNKLKDYKFVHIIYCEPFSSKLIAELKKAGKLIVVENNSTGQLAGLIEAKILRKIDKKVLKYDARAFSPGDVIKGVGK